MIDSSEVSPKDAQALYDGLTYDAAGLRFGGMPKGRRERVALGLIILRRHVAGETTYAIADDLDLAQTNVMRLKREALDQLELPSVEKARLEFLEVCDHQIAFYTRRRDRETETGGTDRVLADWHEKKARVLGSFAPVQVEAQVTEISAEERELHQLIAEQERENLARSAEVVVFDARPGG